MIYLFKHETNLKLAKSKYGFLMKAHFLYIFNVYTTTKKDTINETMASSSASG